LSPDPLGHSETIKLWHHHVKNKRIRLKAAKEFKSLSAIDCRSHLKARYAQPRLQNAPDVRLVIRNQDSDGMDAMFRGQDTASAAGSGKA